MSTGSIAGFGMSFLAFTASLFVFFIGLTDGASRDDVAHGPD
jgi:hypothetical protein